MLSVQSVSKSFGASLVLRDVSFHVNAGERVGLIGPNGCGKTTLLRIVAGLEAPDDGAVGLDAGRRMAYLAQAPDLDTPRSVLSEVLNGVPDVGPARDRLDVLAARLETVDPGAIGAYTQALFEYEALGGYEWDARVPEALAAVGLDRLDPDGPAAALSGGERTRLGLAALVLARPDVVLLDEPTNHLDFPGMEWLERFIASHVGAAVIVSHDRVFLDRTVSKVIELDPATRQAREFTGGYSSYRAALERGVEQTWAAWADQEAEMQRIRAGIRRMEEKARKTENSTIHFHYRKIARKVARKAVVWNNKLDRYASSPDRVERPERVWRMKVEFGDAPRGGEKVMTLEGVGHRFEGDWLFRDVNLTVEHGERVALLGPNGAGKSTLLKIMTGEIDPAEGRAVAGAGVRIGYFAQGTERLDPDATVLDTILRAGAMHEADARNFLHFFLFQGDDALLPVRALSQGQRARLALATLVVSGVNCLLLDEAVAHLDIPSREQFEHALDQFQGTVIFVSHDRAMIDSLATAVWMFQDGTVQRRIAAVPSPLDA